jgi:hypothetical protein
MCWRVGSRHAHRGGSSYPYNQIRSVHRAREMRVCPWNLEPLASVPPVVVPAAKVGTILKDATYLIETCGQLTTDLRG